jgi:hypothetical protein|tara:strand:+ start:131 stop:340 length:210 start_codon:yes stop_codon:yes gene_type:complete
MLAQTDITHLAAKEADKYANEVAAQGIGKYWRTSPAPSARERTEEQVCLHGREKQRTGRDGLPICGRDD